MKFVEILFYPIKLLAMGFIYFYKAVISPMLPHTCRFKPSCSSYALSAIKQFGFFRGVWLAFKRIMRCNPKSKGGIDPVPQNIKGDSKWII